MRRLKRWLSVLLTAALLAAGAAGFTRAENDDNPPPDGFATWEDYFNSLISGGSETEVPVPPLEQMHLAGENENFAFYYHEEGADAYILDKREGKLWSTAVHPDTMDTTGMTPAVKTALLEVGVADKEGVITTLTLTSAATEGFTLSPAYGDGRVTLTVEVKDTGVSFALDMWIDKEGFNCSLPDDAVRETGEGRLVYVTPLPAFGAAGGQEDGYIFYPDGSGALIDIKPYPLPTSEAYSYPLYGPADADLDLLEQNREQDIQNLMLPVFGIKHTSGGFLAAVTTGEETATLHMTMDKVYRAYFQFDYRKYATVEYNFTGNVFDTKTLSELIPDRTAGDRTVKYFLLGGTANTYSDMAAAYRGYLMETGVLKKRAAGDGVPLSVEFFMGIPSNGFFTKKMETLTSFSQAEAILGDLRQAGVNRLEASLSGWCQGGYDMLPTRPKAEGKLGGSSGLSSLAAACAEGGVNLFANMDFLYARDGVGKFNAKKDTIRDRLGKLITDKEEELYLLNPARTLRGSLDKALDGLDSRISLHLLSVGSVAVPDVQRNAYTDRKAAVEAYRENLAYLAGKRKNLAVGGGNAYVLPYATRLYDIPDKDSGYYQNSAAVPFYQMVVHGCVDYSSLAGNLSYNDAYQKLRWVETGSIPHFLITHENPIRLKETSYNRIFSSQYTAWKEAMTAVYQEFNQRLSGVWNQTIERHDRLSADVVRLTYSDGSRTYINYGDSAAQADGQTIPAMDYVVIGAGGTP